MFAIEVIVSPIVIPSPFEISPSDPYHLITIEEVIPIGNDTVQTIVYCCPVMASPSVVVDMMTSSIGTVRVTNMVGCM